MYYAYILLGSLYLLTKIVFFFISDVIGMRAVMHGTTPAVLTMLAGFSEMKALHKGKRRSWEHWVAIVFPLLIIILTPLIMVLEKGPLWLEAERLPVLIIFEALAVAQLVLAVFMFQKFKVR
jgi:hypothetical protein